MALLPALPAATVLTAVAVVLPVATPPAAADGGCVDTVARVAPGETVVATVDGPAWFELASWVEFVYRAEVAGPAGSGLELWWAFLDSDLICLVPQDRFAEAVIGGGTRTMEWTQWSEASVLRVEPPPGSGAATFSVSLVEVASPPSLDTVVVPAAAHRAGVGGTLFSTDLWVFNPGERDAAVVLDLLPDASDVTLHFDAVVAAHQVLRFDDLVWRVFGLVDGRGAVTVASEHGVVARARIFTSGGDGSFGQGVPAQAWSDAAGAGQLWGLGGERRFLPFLAGPPDFRMNVGFVEVLGIDAELQLELIDDHGVSVATATVVVPARSHLQIDDLAGFLGVPVIDGACLVVRVVSLARVLSYASVIDNRSQDATFIPGLLEGDARTVQVVPAAASTEGVRGTRWRTDLGVLPVGPATRVTVEFLPSDGSPPAAATVPFPDAGMLVVEDVVASLGGHGNGALELTADDDILVVSRTFNETSEGTYGQLIAPPSRWRGGIHAGTAIGVESSAAFRTNVGMFNPSRDATVDVLVRLVSADGEPVGSRSYRLGPRRHHQVNNVFAALGVAERADCRVDFLVSGAGTGRTIHAYASVVDNRTGDPTYVPAVAVWDGLDPSDGLGERPVTQPTPGVGPRHARR